MSNWEISLGRSLDSFIVIVENAENFVLNWYILYTLKQMFRLESLPCVYSHDFWDTLLAKVCLDASFTCLFLFVAFCVTFNDLCC